MSAPLVLTWLRAVREAKLTQPAGVMAMAAVLVTYANPDGRSCYPSDPRLAEDLGWKERNVRRVRGMLRDAGFIALERPGLSPGRGGGDGTAAEWRLCLPENDRHSDAAESLIDRHSDASQSGMTGTQMPIDRHSDAGMTGTLIPPTSPATSPRPNGVAVGLSSSGRSTVSLSPREQLVASRLPAATPAERESIVQQLELMKPNNFRAYFRSIPQDDLVALLDAIRTPVASNGNSGGPQSGACRKGTHRECGYDWCTCPHHLAGLS